jgi:parvulin-like peptidyl-prolyl isomerase
VAFAEAANAIAAEGTTSPVVRTSYGFHVILLEEKLPERKPSLAERRVLVAAHLARERARELAEKEVTRLKSASRIEVSRAADALTAQVQIAPAEGALRR